MKKTFITLVAVILCAAMGATAALAGHGNGNGHGGGHGGNGDRHDRTGWYCTETPDCTANSNYTDADNDSVCDNRNSRDLCKSIFSSFKWGGRNCR